MFDFKQQAKTLGDITGQFATLAKSLNFCMLGNDELKQHIGAIIGNGRFNQAAHTLEPGIDIGEITVIYGDQLKAARSQAKVRHTGLLAVIPPIHHPLLGFSQQVMNDLGEQGFICKVEHEGKTLSTHSINSN